MKSKHLKRALEQMAEEGVTRVFKPMIGTDMIVGVVGQLQIDVLAERIRAEYDLKMHFEQAPYETARWVASDDKVLMKRFLEEVRGSLAEDHDGAPVFMARNQLGTEPHAAGLAGHEVHRDAGTGVGFRPPWCHRGRTGRSCRACGRTPAAALSVRLRLFVMRCAESPSHP